MTRTLCSAIAAAAVLIASGSGHAQPYPNRPIQVIIPFAGGSASDVLARLVFERMGISMGQRFVVENKPGGGGNTGTLIAAKAAPDGYNILYNASGPLAVNKSLQPSIGYDPEKDFAPIALTAILPNIIVVNPKLPVKILTELVAYLKARPKQLNYGTVGPGSSQHLAAVYFEQVTGVEMIHVPYRVTGQLVTDLVGGQTELSFQLLPNVLSQLQAGQIRAIAVAADKRLTALPDVPTAREAGLAGYEAAGWFALLAPRGTPQPIIDRLHKEYAAAMADKTLRDRLTELGAEPMVSTPEELSKFMAAEVVKWRGVITKAGITIE